MDKSNLQKLCQAKKWKLPEYIVSKSGPDHNPLFMATVKVNEVNYNSDALFRKAKEAEHSAAKVAFHQLNGATQCAPREILDAQHIYKIRLQSYAIKKGLTLPEYSCELGGVPHAPRFKCKVTFQGKTIGSPEFHSTSKEAEQAAAKCAWEILSLDETQQDDLALYKTLLHEYLQKKGFVVPNYEIISSGPAHMPVYVAKVIIQGKTYEGEAASVKKQAESYAAKVAYLGLQEQLRKEAEERTVSCEQQTEKQEVFTSASHIKEALEVSSTNLQLVIAADVQPRATSKSNILATAGKRDEYTEAAEAAKSAKRLCLPSSDSVRYVEISPSNRNNAYLQVGSSDTRRTTDETVAIRPRKPDMTIPPGSMVFPLSDDQWAAVKTVPKE